MSCNLNWPTPERPPTGSRRAWLRGAVGLTALTGLSAQAADVQPLRLPSDAPAPADGRPPEIPPELDLRGRGTFRRFGFHVYDARLWSTASEPLRPPLALELSYRRSIQGRDIVAASLDEMRRLGAPSALLDGWQPRLQSLFPDVRDGDRITGLQTVSAARFWFNGRAIGQIEDAAFARWFFGIWLDPRTRAPALRAALLGASAQPRREGSP